MKGFQFLRFWGKFSNSEYGVFKEGCLKQEIEEMGKDTGKRLIFCGLMSWAEFNMLHKVGIDVEEISPGVYRDIEPEKKGKKEKPKKARTCLE